MRKRVVNREIKPTSSKAWKYCRTVRERVRRDAQIASHRLGPPKSLARKIGGADGQLTVGRGCLHRSDVINFVSAAKNRGRTAAVALEPGGVDMDTSSQDVGAHLMRIPSTWLYAVRGEGAGSRRWDVEGSWPAEMGVVETSKDQRTTSRVRAYGFAA